MRHLTLFLLLLMWALGAACQVSQDSTISIVMEDSVSSLYIRPVKHPNQLLKQIMNQIEIEASQQDNEERTYKLEAKYTLDDFPPFSASCILPARIDSIPIKGFIEDSIDVILKNLCFEGPYKLTSRDSIRMKQILFDATRRFQHTNYNDKKDKLELNWPAFFAPYIKYKKLVRFCNVKAYSIGDESGRGVYRLHLTNRTGHRYLENYVLPEYRAEIYFDRQTIRLTKFKCGVKTPSLRWKTTEDLQQFEYEERDGKTVLNKYRFIGVFNGKIKERITISIL